MFAYCLNEPVGRIEVGGYASVDNLEAMEDRELKILTLNLAREKQDY